MTASQFWTRLTSVQDFKLLQSLNMTEHHSNGFCGKRSERWPEYHFGDCSQINGAQSIFAMPEAYSSMNFSNFDETLIVPVILPRHGGSALRTSPRRFDTDNGTTTFENSVEDRADIQAGPELNQTSSGLLLQASHPGDDSPLGCSTKIYHALSSSDRFRLLEVLPGTNNTVQCKLHVCSLNRPAILYEALSYTWGIDKTSDKREVQLTAYGTNQALPVSRNLHDALLALRRSNESRFIWADAVCINQDDTKERSQQVKLMGKIFQGAWQVVIWVGEQQDRCYCGKMLLDSSLGSSTEALAGICSIVNRWLAQQGRFDIRATYSTAPASEQPSKENDPDLGTSSQHRDTGNIWESDSRVRGSVLRFFTRAWFSRIWVIQESVLAKSAVLQLGPHQISWDWVGIAAAILVHSPLLTRDGSKRESIPTEVSNAYLMYRLSASQTYLEPLEFTFVQLLQLPRRFNSKEPRDKIYGLLGLPATDSIAELIVPDYDAKTEKVYEAIAWLILESKSPLRFLSLAGTFGRCNSSSPSWIPSWHKHRPWTMVPINSHTQFECASRTPVQIDSTHQRSELALQGVIVGKVGSVQEKARWPPQMFRLLRLLDDTRSFISKVSWSKQKWHKVAMTLTCGSDSMGYPVGDSISHFADFAAALLSQKIDYVLNDLITLDKFNHLEIEEVLGVDELELLARDGRADRFIGALAPMRYDYRVFATEASIFGTGPINMKVGDLLCILFGAEVPFLLRPHRNGYIVIGECYAYDLMHGEVLEELASNPEGELKSTWLKLI